MGDGRCEEYVTPAPTPEGCDTCLVGRVGHWNFDNLSSGYTSSSDGNTIIERGSSESLVGVDASITGSGSVSPLVDDGKFGSALRIPAGTANYAVSLRIRSYLSFWHFFPFSRRLDSFLFYIIFLAPCRISQQMSASGLVKTAPSNGFASSIWIRPETNSSSPQGIVFERKYNNFDLYSQHWMNIIGCSVRDESYEKHKAEHSFGSNLDPSRWYHIVCSYDHITEDLMLYIDGIEVANASVALSSFPHGNWFDNDDMQLGVGNRPSSLDGIPGHSAGSNHFVGAVDDFVLWDRPLSGEEVALLYASDRAVEDQGGGGAVTSSPTVDPSSRPSDYPSFRPSTSPTITPTARPSSGPSMSPSFAAPLLWSEPSTWPSGVVPEDGDDVIIPEGVTIALDVPVVPSSGGLGVLTIDGTLVNHGNGEISLSASSIVVTETGTFQLGSSDELYEGQATITLTGKKAVPSLLSFLSRSLFSHLFFYSNRLGSVGAPDPTTTFERSEDNALENDGTRRVLAVRGGSLIMHSSTPNVISTKLNQNAAAGETTLTLADGVDWRAGDLIAVSTTDYYFGETHYADGDPSFAQTEVFEVAIDTGGSNHVTVTEPLQNNRWGALQYVTDAGMSLIPGTVDAPSPITPTMLDERAEIIHLSRNIVIQGADDAHWQDGFGAHVIVSGASSVAQVEGVVFLRGGQRRTMGRYPFHW